MEEKHEDHKHSEQHAEHKKEYKLPFKIKLTKWDIIALIALIVFLAMLSMVIYASKDDCEVARPNYKCASLKDVMIENCLYWGKYSCDTNADLSLPDIEWYIGKLCSLQNEYHNTGLDCSNLKSACNKITGSQTCPTGLVG